MSDEAKKHTIQINKRKRESDTEESAEEAAKRIRLASTTNPCEYLDARPQFVVDVKALHKKLYERLTAQDMKYKWPEKFTGQKKERVFTLEAFLAWERAVEEVPCDNFVDALMLHREFLFLVSEVLEPVSLQIVAKNLDLVRRTAINVLLHRLYSARDNIIAASRGFVTNAAQLPSMVGGKFSAMHSKMCNRLTEMVNYMNDLIGVWGRSIPDHLGQLDIHTPPALFSGWIASVSLLFVKVLVALMDIMQVKFAVDDLNASGITTTNEPLSARQAFGMATGLITLFGDDEIIEIQRDFHNIIGRTAGL